MSGVWPQAEFGDIVAVAKRCDAEIGFAERLDLRRAAQRGELPLSRPTAPSAAFTACRTLDNAIFAVSARSVVPCAQSISGRADDLEGEPTWQRDGVVEDIAGVGRNAEIGCVGRGLRKKASPVACRCFFAPCRRAPLRTSLNPVDF